MIGKSYSLLSGFGAANGIDLTGFEVFEELKFSETDNDRKTYTFNAQTSWTIIWLWGSGGGGGNEYVHGSGGGAGGLFDIVPNLGGETIEYVIAAGDTRRGRNSTVHLPDKLLVAGGGQGGSSSYGSVAMGGESTGGLINARGGRGSRDSGSAGTPGEFFGGRPNGGYSGGGAGLFGGGDAGSSGVRASRGGGGYAGSRARNDSNYGGDGEMLILNLREL